MSVPTLYGISAELLNLMAEREDIALESTQDTTFGDIAAQLRAKDIEIREHVTALVKKVDGAAFYVREFAARAAAAKAEKERNRDREHQWEARGERLKEYIVAVMQMMGKDRLDGDSNTLRLQKCPPSVEIAQPELVPKEYKPITLKISQELWEAILAEISTPLLKRVNSDSTETIGEPSKSKIGEALKQQIPCERCDGRGWMGQTTTGDAVSPQNVQCAACGGTGKVNQGVPGARLVVDKMSLRVE